MIDGRNAKGDVLTVAELAGVMGAKRTSDLIPLCHPLALTDLLVQVVPDRAAGVLRIRAEAATVGPTGVEMEALTAASVAALTVYDMVKGVERGVEIRSIRLLSKTGGKSGDWVRSPAAEQPPAVPGHRPGDRVGRPDQEEGRHVTDRSALVLTASDRSAEGSREDTSGQVDRRPAGGARVHDRAAGRCRRAVADRGGPGRGRRPPPADRDDRRHRADPARRDPPGDDRRDRLRGARAGRGDARRRPPLDTPGQPVAGGGRRPRPDPDREPAGQPARRGREPRGDRGRPAPRPRDPGRPVRARRGARPVSGFEGIFGHVPGYPLVFPLFWGSVVFFALVMARHLRIFAAVRATGPSPFADVPRRVGGLVRYTLLQTKMFKDRRAGIMHFAIFWGFVLLDDRDGQHRDRRGDPGADRDPGRRRPVDGRLGDAEHRRGRSSWWPSAMPSSAAWSPGLHGWHSPAGR